MSKTNLLLDKLTPSLRRQVFSFKPTQLNRSPAMQKHSFTNNILPWLPHHLCHKSHIQSVLQLKSISVCQDGLSLPPSLPAWPMPLKPVHDQRDPGHILCCTVACTRYAAHPSLNSPVNRKEKSTPLGVMMGASEPRGSLRYLGQ